MRRAKATQHFTSLYLTRLSPVGSLSFRCPYWVLPNSSSKGKKKYAEFQARKGALYIPDMKSFSLSRCASLSKNDNTAKLGKFPGLQSVFWQLRLQLVQDRGTDLASMRAYRRRPPLPRPPARQAGLSLNSIAFCVSPAEGGSHCSSFLPIIDGTTTITCTCWLLLHHPNANFARRLPQSLQH